MSIRVYPWFKGNMGYSSPEPGMWHNLLIALALLLVIEGVWPFLSPGGLRRTLQTMIEQDDRSLRIAGLTSMSVGVLLLYLVN